MTPEDKKKLLGHLNHLYNLGKNENEANFIEIREEAARKGWNAIFFALKSETRHRIEPIRASHELLGG